MSHSSSLGKLCLTGLQPSHPCPLAALLRGGGAFSRRPALLLPVGLWPWGPCRAPGPQIGLTWEKGHSQKQDQIVPTSPSQTCGLDHGETRHFCSLSDPVQWQRANEFTIIYIIVTSGLWLFNLISYSACTSRSFMKAGLVSIWFSVVFLVPTICMVYHRHSVKMINWLKMLFLNEDLLLSWLGEVCMQWAIRFLGVANARGYRISFADLPCSGERKGASWLRGTMPRVRRVLYFHTGYIYLFLSIATGCMRHAEQPRVECDDSTIWGIVW